MFASENLSTASSQLTQNKLEGMIDRYLAHCLGKGGVVVYAGLMVNYCCWNCGKHVERPPSSAQQRFFSKKKCFKILVFAASTVLGLSRQ